MPLTAGTQLGNCLIVGPLGAGGMGEVYRARDTRLGREVAIKILPDAFAQDGDRMRRFEQEARAVAALNHPNVLSVFDIGTADGVTYLVCELLDGETLRDALARGPLPSRKATDFGRQIADGLAAAHEKGIVHRDLKPENVFLTRSGRVKILDFGLAKMTGRDLPAGTDPETTLATATTPGVVLGTVGYMAPEQVRGETTIDHRADIFSFGATLFEMLTGHRAFQGQSSVETLHAILKDDPSDIDTDALRVSPGLDRIVRHCLEKKPEHRFQSASDLMFALSVLSESSGRVEGAPIVPRRRSWLIPATAALAAAVIAGATAWVAVPGAPPEPRREFAIAVPGEVNHLALSANGQWLAFVSPGDTGVPRVYVQRLGVAEPRVIAGSDGASYPFFSPDGAFVAFFANGKLVKTPTGGGGVQAVVSVGLAARGGAWGSAGVIVYAPDAGGHLWRVNADGSGAAALTAKLISPEETTHRWPFFLPDGDRFLMFGGNFLPGNEHNGLYLSSLSKGEKVLLAAARSGGAIAGGQLYYVDANGALVAAPVDIAGGKTTGPPVMVAAKVSRSPSTYYTAFAASADSTVIYSGDIITNQSQLTWFDATGKELGRIGPVNVIANPALSRDGTRVAYDSNDFTAANVDVWTWDLRQGTESRFTFDPAEEVTPIWSHDDETIAYRTVRGIFAILELKKTNGLEANRPMPSLPESTWDMIPNDWTADGRHVLSTVQVSDGTSNLVLQPVDGGALKPLVTGPASETNGQISPDGKWVAYASNESGGWEVYVTTFPAAAGKWQVSRNGGTEPRWRRDGKALFYIAAQQMLTEVAVDTSSSFSVGTPQSRFPVRARAPISSTDLFTYDVASDGRRFLVNQYVKPPQSPPLNIILHADSAAVK